VAVPRRFDRRPPERDTTRINERIRVPEVRLIDDQGAQVGVLKTPDALRFAQERDLDLVEVAPEARPPVCRVLDYSKYKYEQAQKVKQARKHQQQITVREIKFRPKIAQHDYDTKKHHVERFLRHRDKVKVTIMFRGREVTHPERGTLILDRLAEELAELGVVEQRPMQEGRNMTMMLGPSKGVLAGRFDASPDGAGPAAADGPDGTSAQGDGAPRAAPETASPEAASEAAPGEASSGDGPPGESASETGPAETAQTAPAQEAPAREDVEESVPEQPAAIETAPAGHAPEGAVTEQPAAIETAPAEPAPEGAISEQ
jgi:translation initiation factor IF-3